jgi:hypothetical protein
MLNDLRVRERYTSRNNGERRRRPGKTRYRHFLGEVVAGSILSARPENYQDRGGFGEIRSCLDCVDIALDSNADSNVA